MGGFAARLAAWAVHGLTASGAVVALLSLVAIHEGRLRLALAWMALAVVIDGIDGAFARSLRVAERLPQIRGAELDNLVDYANYVLVPAFLLASQDMLPGGWAWLATAGICLVSGVRFAHTEAKTADLSFTGFPSYWNVLVFYLLALQTSSRVNLAVVLVLVALVLVPIRCVYPSRTPTLRRTTLAFTGVWALTLAAIWWSWPGVPRWWIGVSLVYPAYYLTLSLYLTYSARVGKK